jgi:hypothetical protein
MRKDLCDPQVLNRLEAIRWRASRRFRKAEDAWHEARADYGLHNGIRSERLELLKKERDAALSRLNRLDALRTRMWILRRVLLAEELKTQAVPASPKAPCVEEPKARASRPVSPRPGWRERLRSWFSVTCLALRNAAPQFVVPT